MHKNRAVHLACTDFPHDPPTYIRDVAFVLNHQHDGYWEPTSIEGHPANDPAWFNHEQSPEHHLQVLPAS
ncbi:hypothetical protein, partial [Marivita sp.]|uniref:hypothetical protein n=1 Tax=Marivita sp. TaxID=2003365 RepID=UPI0025C16FC0